MSSFLAKLLPSRSREEETTTGTTDVSSSPEPKKRKVDGKPAATAASSSDTNDAVASPSDSPSTKLYEFKFDSLESNDFDNHEISGKFYIPLLVDNNTGELSFPQEQSCAVDVNGTIRWRLNMRRGSYLNMPLRAKIIPCKREIGKNDLGTDSRLPSEGDHTIRLGIRFNRKDKEITSIDWDDIDDPTDWDNVSKTEFVSLHTIDTLAQNVGGAIKFETDYNDHLWLYTVISEFRPGQTHEKLELPKFGTKPCWERLEKRVMNHPTLKDELEDVKSAMIEYKRYIAIKILKDDHNSEKFAPSPDVDKVWHLHMIFVEEYQQDCMAFAEELKNTKSSASNVEQTREITKPFGIQHCPFLLDDTRKRYLVTLDWLKNEEFSDMFGKKVDWSMWPDVDNAYPYSGPAGCC